MQVALEGCTPHLVVPQERTPTVLVDALLCTQPLCMMQCCAVSCAALCVRDSLLVRMHA